MAEAAFEAGYSLLGFFSHAPLPFDTTWNLKWPRLGDYAATVRPWRRGGLHGA